MSWLRIFFKIYIFLICYYTVSAALWTSKSSICFPCSSFHVGGGGGSFNSIVSPFLFSLWYWGDQINQRLAEKRAPLVSLLSARLGHIFLSSWQICALPFSYFHHTAAVILRLSYSLGLVSHTKLPFRDRNNNRLFFLRLVHIFIYIYIYIQAYLMRYEKGTGWDRVDK